MHDPSDYQGREGFEALRKVKDEMAKIDHPAILKPAAPLEDKVEGRKLLYRQYTCDPQGLAALCCDLDSKGYEPVQIVPGFFGSGVQGPFHSAMGWTVLARMKPEPPPIGFTPSFSSSVPVVTDVKLDESGKVQATREHLPVKEVSRSKRK